ncbi:MAG: glycosyltransferase family 9 protein [Selenomonadaceae bacterium]|nr:glycosyltransferase family 9 protein [Selenomonadaceae bacterium]
MNDKQIINALNKYAEKFIKAKNFDVKDFINFMEEKFSSAGYRTPPKIGEKLNVLIIHDAGIGDFVLQSGAIREIRRLYPAANITLVVNIGSVNLAEHCPYVDEVISLKEFGKDFTSMYKTCAEMAQKLLRCRQDICYAFIHRAWTPFLMYMSGARIRIAPPVKEIDDLCFMSKNNAMLKSLDFFATDFVSMFAYNGEHMVDGFLSMIDSALKAPVDNRELEVWYTALDLTAAQNFLEKYSRPIYAVAMGGVEFMKHYPPKKYAKLAEKILIDEPTATFVILGGGNDDLKSAQIFKQTLGEKIFNKHVIDFTNKINFRQLAAILSLCDMYIGNDTGAMHVAAAVKCPVLTPNCFAENLPHRKFDSVRYFCPYHVPSVVAQPKYALDGCKVTKPYDSMGCRVNKPHCITQIEPETLYHGYHLLKVRIADKINTPLYIN